MSEHLRPAVVMLALFTVLTGLAYPLAVTGIAQLALPSLANGSLVARDGTIAGSSLIGQAFTTERYFHGRPSATSAQDPKDDTKTIDAPYNAANSSGSNLGPISQKLLDHIKADTIALKTESGLTVVPADAVTASGSGLDPHISPAYAKAQVARIAKARSLPQERLLDLIAQIAEHPVLGLIGEARVNVFNLNLALDKLAADALSSR